MWRTVLIALFLMTGCASSHHEDEVETKTPVVEHEHREHHGSNDCGSDNVGQDILEDVESSILGGILSGIFQAIFHHDDD